MMKSKLSTLAVSLLTLGCAAILSGFLLPLLFMEDSYPKTFSFGCYGLFETLPLSGFCLLILGIVQTVLQKNGFALTPAPTLVSMAIGADIAVALYCGCTALLALLLESDVSRHPLALHWGFNLCIGALVLLPLLALLYLVKRKGKASAETIALDIGTAYLTLFALLPLGEVARALLSQVALTNSW